MKLLSTSTRLCLRPLARTPHTHTRPISSLPTRRPPPFFPPPPARRNFEYTTPDVHPANKDGTNPRIERRPVNRQIPFDHVFLLDPETNKLSRTKRRLADLLALLSPTRTSTHTGVTPQPVSFPRGAVLELVTSSPEPIVRVTTRTEVEARYREMKRALKKGARVGEEPKEVQLTWGVERADLEHKLRKGRRDLEKGYRVIVVVSIKGKRRPSSQEELVAFADEIAEMLGEVGEECKEREFTQRQVVLSFRKTGANDDVS